MTAGVGLSSRLRLIIEEHAADHPVWERIDALNPRPVGETFRQPALVGCRRGDTFTVIVPSYNYARYLEAAVRSALDQPGVHVQVVVIDDGSTDGSVEVARRLVNEDSRVELIEVGCNRGPTRAFNDGFAVARGEFIVRLDADDLLVPGALARAADVFGAYPSVGLVYGRPRHFSSIDPPAGRNRAATWTHWRGPEWLAERCRRGVNCITTPEAVVRTSVMRDVGPWNVEIRHATDLEMWLRASAVSDVVRIDGPDHALHREHGSSLSATEVTVALTDLEERRSAFDAALQTVRHRARELENLDKVWRSTLAREALSHVIHARDRGRDDLEDLDPYVLFAARLQPEWAQTPEGRLVVGRRDGWPLRPLRRPAAVLRSARHALRSQFDLLRWVRRGV